MTSDAKLSSQKRPPHHPLLVCKLALTHREQGETKKKEAEHFTLIGGRFNKQGNLHRSRSLHLPSRTLWLGLPGGLRIHPAMQGRQVQSLVRELSSHMLHCMAIHTHTHTHTKSLP